MRTTQQFSITLPNELAAVVKAKVAAGEYTTESEMIRDGLRTLVARDQAIETWLRKEVSRAHDALTADPSRVVNAANVRATLAAAHRVSKSKKRVSP
jgi:antitoxin ParD1/3/4